MSDPIADSRALATYQQACAYLDQGLIRTTIPPGPPRCDRRQWMEWFLPRLGHPERAFPAIHVAGTSGKGSVAVMIAHMLRVAGLPVGLHVSPYLQLATEKLWVAGRYASAGEFADLVEWIRPHAEACRAPEVPLHGMVSVALALEHFRRKQVALAVMEVGVGGRQDLTNVLRTRVAVITAVGLDHLKTLGPTLADIAWHKAGIIKPGCAAVVLEGPAVPAAREQARAVGVSLRVLRRSAFQATMDRQGRTTLAYQGPLFQLADLELGLAGVFQGENAALAIAAVEALGQTNPAVTERCVREGLQQARLPGRMELIRPPVSSPCPVLLDGAHNPDKIAAMIDTVQRLSWRRLHTVYGALSSRPPDAQLARFAQRCATLILTEPRVYAKPAWPAAELRASLNERCPAKLIVEPDPEAALSLALKEATAEDLVLITGSIYLCGELRQRWYPAAQVLQMQRSWF